uniref:Uncharacterized protein n=1 Tax=Romanomermis culicivorax TaxID=13658 RepID=A0A915JN85_ROMCU
WVQKIGYHACLPPNQQLKRFQPSSTIDRYEVPLQSPPPVPPPQPPLRPQRSSSLTDRAATSIIVIEDETSTPAPLTPTKNVQRRPAPQPPASSTLVSAKENDSGFLSNADEQSRKATTSDSPFATPGLPNVPFNGIHSTPLNGNGTNDVFVPGVLKYDRNGVQNGGGKDFATTKEIKMREKSQTLPPLGPSNGARKLDHIDSLDSKSVNGDTSDGSSSIEIDKKKKRSSKIGQFFRSKIRESPKEINE